LLSCIFQDYIILIRIIFLYSVLMQKNWSYTVKGNIQYLCKVINYNIFIGKEVKFSDIICKTRNNERFRKFIYILNVWMLQIYDTYQIMLCCVLNIFFNISHWYFKFSALKIKKSIPSYFFYFNIHIYIAFTTFESLFIQNIICMYNKQWIKQ
jgi:hypothetical protein